MANTKSAEKQNRQRIKRRARNLFHLTTTRTLVKKAVNAIVDSTEQKSAQTKADGPVAVAMRQLNKAAQRGVLKKKTASRKISRLAKALAKSKIAAQA